MNEQTVEETKIEVLENGPLVVRSNLNLTHANGNTESRERITTFCRYGASANTPFYDGAHRGIEF